jgi:Family of unknown function (DUF6496)
MARTKRSTTTRKTGSRKYGPKAQAKMKKVMHERKAGTLRSGRSGKKVTSRKQAIAIGLSEARRAGAKVPKRKTSTSTRPETKAKAKATTKSKSTRSTKRKAS